LRGNYDVMIAHELLHTSSVWHHGEGDALRLWKVTGDASEPVNLAAGGVPRVGRQAAWSAQRQGGRRATSAV